MLRAKHATSRPFWPGGRVHQRMCGFEVSKLTLGGRFWDISVTISGEFRRVGAPETPWRELLSTCQKTWASFRGVQAHLPAGC